MNPQSENTQTEALQIEDPKDSSSVDALVERVLAENPGRACITCSFQAECMVVLHILRKRLPHIPVLFLDTGYHFPETYSYRDRMAREWKLNLVNVLPLKTVAEQERSYGLLYRSDPGRCCRLRKVEPLMAALEDYGLWFTGLRREQSPSRKNLKILEHHQTPRGKTLFKVNVLAAWEWPQVQEYMSTNGIEYLPLYAQGYPSIGCQPCTAVPSDASNPRSGRWGGEKLECGIHTFSKPLEG